MYPLTIKRALGFGLLVMLIAALSACGGGSGSEENKKSATGGPPTNGQIAFRRWFDPDHTKGALFTMNPDGSHVRQITYPPEGWRDDVPAWSPDGERIAFYRQRIDERMSRIMIVNPDTGDVREVTHCGPDQGWSEEHQAPSAHHCVSDFDPAWAPDGDSLSFHRILSPDTAEHGGPDGIFIVGIDGSDPHPVTEIDWKLADETGEEASAVSPNGTMLVFDRPRLMDGEEQHALFVQPIGSPEDAHQITPWNLNCQDHPEFSPDGKLVLFRCLPKGDEGPSNLYWIHPDGTGLHKLTHEDADKQYLGSDFSPSFSSGEGWITAGRTGGYGDEGNADVFRLLIKDGDVERSVNLTKSEIWDSATDWGAHPPVG